MTIFSVSKQSTRIGECIYCGAWFNHEPLLAPLGYGPPAEFEAQFYETQNTHTAVGVLN